ncbi:hypothetical protein ATX71_00350 [Oenococcus oeni]|nr:hypothetical protein C5H79_03905 [Oenococcus oeni]MDQ8695897.1 hypothetical protein [Oenococcus oeni]MDQ8718206.1 hypothetical protein [Oenococcus oeni]MDS0177267.1 hypothetical protein [Oenococcus oeni]OIK60008.1 hypothetical protein ATW60_00365 [Oenococcus oeni]
MNFNVYKFIIRENKLFMAYIQVQHLYKRYQMGNEVIEANRDINFTINKGELVIILGSSGAGKYT